MQSLDLQRTKSFFCLQRFIVRHFELFSPYGIKMKLKSLKQGKLEAVFGKIGTKLI